MNKQQLKNFFKSKKMKKLLIYLGIAVVGIAAIVGVAIFMDASNLSIVNAYPTVSDRCSDRVEDDLFLDNASYLIRSCDCNVVGSIQRKHGKTDEICTNDSALLIEGYESAFNALGTAYSDFLKEFSSYSERRKIAPTDREYAYYAEFYKQATEIYISSKGQSEAALLPVELEASADFSKSVLIGINGDFSFTFAASDLSAENLASAQADIANLFGYKSFVDFRKNAQYNLLDELHAYLALGVTNETPFNPLKINGGVITQDGSLILPYVFVNEKNEYVLSYLIYDEATDTLALWFNDAEKASSLLMPAGDASSFDATIDLYGRCALFEQSRAVEMSAGSVSGSGRYSSGSTKTVKAAANAGFTFRNWTNADGSLASEKAEYTLEIPQSNLTLTANWNVTRQKLILHITDEITEESEFTVLNNTFFIPAPTLEGYTFLGWEHRLTGLLGVEKSEAANDYVKSGTTSNVELYAKWAKSGSIHYHFTEADIAAGAYNNPENPTTFIVGEKTIIKEPTKNEEGNSGGKYVFDGWYLDAVYSTMLDKATIPADRAEDIHLYAKWTERTTYYNIIKENGKTYIELGSYPQKILDDQRTILEIKSAIAKGKVTPDPETGIFEFENTPYLRTTATPYQAHTFFSDGSEVLEETEYFFIIEPIRWRVLSGDPTNPDSELLLLSESVLDSHLFRENLTPRSIDGKTVYANNWAGSDLRTFLNDEFYKAAFKSGEAQFIQETKVDFSKDTAHLTRYANGGSCIDKIFLLSYSDMVNEKYGWKDTFTAEDNLKMARATDYSKARGVYSSLAQSKEYLDEHDSAHWWLVSPGDFEYSAALTTAPGTLGTYKVNCEAIGVRPAIKVKLGSN